MRKCNNCHIILQYPFLVNYELGEFIGVEYVKERKKSSKNETKDEKIMNKKTC